MKEATLNELLSQVASEEPTPGGGSVSALMGALGTALLAMVCNLTLGKKRFSEVQEQVEEVLTKVEERQESFLRLAEEDSRSFERLFAFLQKKELSEEELEQKREAEEEAIAVPQQIMETALDAAKLAGVLAPMGNPNAISDVGVALECLRSAFFGAELNVLINMRTLNQDEQEGYRQWLAEIRVPFTELYAQTTRYIREQLEK